MCISNNSYWSSASLGLCLLAVVMSGKAAETSLVSVASNGTQGEIASFDPTISADGRYVAFVSESTNLVVPDNNGPLNDVFVHDRVDGATTRISVDSNGIQGNGASLDPSISAGGRYVAFSSRSTNLVLPDNNGILIDDVFVHDRFNGTTTLVSVNSNGTQGNNSSFDPSISADGRYIAFQSASDNLVTPDDNGPVVDVFVRDRVDGTTTLVSVDSNGTQGNNSSFDPSISADGRFVAFLSRSTNLVMPDNTPTVRDLFVHDRVDGTTTRVSVNSNGTQANNTSSDPSISADGRYVAFESGSINLVMPDDNGPLKDVFVHDRVDGTTTRVSVDSDGNQGNLESNYPSISADGRYVAFISESTNLVSQDNNGLSDMFVHDRVDGTTTRVSVNSNGIQGNGNISSDFGSSISANGRYVSFSSESTNLVSPDDNNIADVFVHDQGTKCESTGPTNQVIIPSMIWVQLAPPCLPVHGATIAELFEDDIVDGELFDGTNAAIATHAVYLLNGLNQTYDLGQSSTVVMPGEGMWFIQLTENEITVDVPVGSRGQASNWSPMGICPQTNSGCVSTPLNNVDSNVVVWTMAGVPFFQNEGVAFSDLLVLSDNGDCADEDACTPAEANAAQLMSNVFYHYNVDAPTGYDSSTTGSTLDSWKGYWVGAFPNAGPLNPVLLFPESQPTTYTIGDAGPGGGIVFHVTGGGLHGLEAPPVDQSIDVVWCDALTDIASVDNISSVGTPDSHSGVLNTPLIASACNSSAADVAADFVLNGVDDWFLPNKEELDLLYVQRAVVSGFAVDSYWGSSEISGSSAWFQSFASGDQATVGKANTRIRVRAVRAF